MNKSVGLWALSPKGLNHDVSIVFQTYFIIKLYKFYIQIMAMRDENGNIFIPNVGGPFSLIRY